MESLYSEGGAGESEVQGYPKINVEFEDSLGCMRPCLKTLKTKKQKRTFTSTLNGLAGWLDTISAKDLF